MTPTRKTLAIAAATSTLLGSAALIWAAGEKPAQRAPRAAVHVESEKAEFKEVAPGVTKAVLWGNPEKGPYGAFTKFQPGQRNELHTHTNDLRIVVLRGAYIYQPETGETIRVKAGDYLSVPGGVRHVSGGDTTDGVLMYEESQGKFDLLFVTKPK